MGVDILLGNLLSLYLFSPSKIALFPQFSYKVLGVLPRLVWSQRSCGASLLSQLWEDLRSFRKWECISLRLSGSVGIQAHAVAEAPTGVARALLYVHSQRLSLLPSLPSSIKNYTSHSTIHTFHHDDALN